ncbi:MAG: ATP-binding protein [Chloroflexi bacterium]|nr:ATP-binding protein [Chloroflexota bacterium]
MADERWLRIPGVLVNVATACDFVVEVAQNAGMNERAIYHCRLAVEEACTNVIEHGYQFNGADKVIDVVCQTFADEVIITIMDDGPPYNPLTKSEPDPKTPLWERNEGGWGVAFIKKVMDRVDYRHEGNRNHLILSKRIH